MSDSLLGLISALSGTVLGGLISHFSQRTLMRHELEKIREEYKTEFKAETAVTHFLKNKQYTDRSFVVIKKYLGGFEDDELRKILVRAGAIRTYNNDGEEMWRLLGRMEEFVEKKFGSKS